MVSSGLELNLDCIENVKNTPMFQQTAHQISHAASLGSKKLVTRMFILLAAATSQTSSFNLVINCG